MNKDKPGLPLAVIAISAIAAAILIGVLLAVLLHLAPPVSSNKPQEETTAPDVAAETAAPIQKGNNGVWGSTVTIDGKTWKLNRKQKVVLAMGVDSKESVQSMNQYAVGGHADTILLLILNDEDRTIRMVEISRDTMVEVDVYDQDRKHLYSGPMQLTLQYAVSDSPQRGCMLMKRKVSEMLYGLPIDSYFSVTLDGLVTAVDIMGGLTVTMEQDWTQIDPKYTAGTQITMDSAEAERFVRYRDTNTSGSNNVRMQRHDWLIKTVFQQLSHTDSDMPERLLEELDPYIETDMDAEVLKKMMTYALLDGSVKLPGETILGDEHDEYYLDEDALEGVLLELFYVPQE